MDSTIVQFGQELDSYSLCQDTIPYEATIVQAPLVIFTIFDFTPFFCFGQHIQTKQGNNDTQQHTPNPLPPFSKANIKSDKDDPKALQLHKLYILTLTSDYVVTQTATSYSYSSSTTTISSISSTPTDHSGESISSSSSSSLSKDTAILVGSLVGGLGGLLIIGIGLFLIFRKRNGKADLPASSSSFYIDQQDDYGGGRGFSRNSHVRAFVPPLLYDYHQDPSLSTPTTSIEVSSSQQHHQLHGHPYNTTDALIQAYYQQEDTISKNFTLDDINNRHVPNENDQVAGSERHVPHLVD